MGPFDEYKFEERVSGFARRDSRNDPARWRRHCQHQFPCGEKRVRGWRHLLCFEMGPARIERLHGGGAARARNSRKHAVSWKRGNGIFGARAERSLKSAEAGRCGARSGNDRDAERAKFPEWGRAEAVAESLTFPLDNSRYHNYINGMSSPTNRYQ